MTKLFTFLNIAGFDDSNVPNCDLPLPSQLVGLELEVDVDAGESHKTVFPEAFRPEWTRKSDGSLSNGYEYVLTGPLAGDNLVSAVYKLYSGRTSVYRTYTGSTHIHLNMLDGTTVENLQALALLTYAIESLLYYVGDNSRQWCGYANRMTSAPHIVLENILTKHITASSMRKSLEQAGRYYGLNLAALNKYGTVEFRYFPTATSAEEMLSWVKLVQMLKKAACDMGNIETVLETLTDKSKYSQFVQTYLSDYAEAVEVSCPYGKVRVLANKALVIANAANPQTTLWNKELLSEVFFRQAVDATQSILPAINPKIINTSIDSAVPAAGTARAAAIEEGYDSVLMSYGSTLYVCRSSDRFGDWEHVSNMGSDLEAAYIAAAENAGLDVRVEKNRWYKNSVSASKRNDKFVPYKQRVSISAMPDSDDACYTDTFDDVESVGYDDEEDY